MVNISSISFLSQSNSQIIRLKEMNFNLQDLQRQLATQKKSESYSGLGFDALNVQRYRMDKSRMDSYLGNIDLVTTRINVMSDSLSRASELAREFLSGLYGQQGASEIDMETVKRQAQINLDFVLDLANQEVDGRYLFAGSNSSTPPISDPDAALTNMQGQVTNWLNGTQTTSQTISNINGFGITSLGFDPSMSSSSSVTIRIDDGTDVDYTSIGASNGMQDIIRLFAMMAAMEVPDPMTDVPTANDFASIVDEAIRLTRQGVSALDQANAQLSGKMNIIKSLQENHEQDIGLFETLIAKKENADTAEVAVKISSLQTQLSASYQVTSFVSQLSLVNYL
jgi:flagellar hook-associated protein 3 FlgL